MGCGNFRVGDSPVPVGPEGTRHSAPWAFLYNFQRFQSFHHIFLKFFCLSYHTEGKFKMHFRSAVHTLSSPAGE